MEGHTTCCQVAPPLNTELKNHNLGRRYRTGKQYLLITDLAYHFVSLRWLGVAGQRGPSSTYGERRDSGARL